MLVELLNEINPQKSRGWKIDVHWYNTKISGNMFGIGLGKKKKKKQDWKMDENMICRNDNKDTSRFNRWIHRGTDYQRLGVFINNDIFHWRWLLDSRIWIWKSYLIQCNNCIAKLSPSPFAFKSSQHQGQFQWVSSLRQVAKILELQLQHQAFRWILRVDFP